MSNSNVINSINSINTTVDNRYTIKNIKINYNHNSVDNNDTVNFSKKISQFEINVALYIHKKYFDNKNRNVKNNNHKSKPKESESKIIAKDAYLNKLFMFKKYHHSNIQQIKIELKEIESANQAYNEDPKCYLNKKTEFGYPDKFRCNFIRYDKHKFSRCKCKITNDDPENMFCTRHYLVENEHINEYLKLKSEVKKK